MYTRQSELLYSLLHLIPNIDLSDIMYQYPAYTLIFWMDTYLTISISGEVFEVVDGIKTKTSTSVLLETLLKYDK